MNIVTMSDKTFYITTPIYYPSGKPHMGHAYTGIVSDVFARFKRLDDHRVLFLTGTDEHGLKMQREAEKKSKDIKFFCDELSNKFKDLTKILNLSNDDFIRTTEKRHFKAVEEIWKRLIDSRIFIFPNIKVGIQFLMRLIMMMMKLKLKIMKNIRFYLDQKLNG